MFLGLDKVKGALERLVLRPMRCHNFYKNSPIRLPSGILLYGYPGCGKTFVARALSDTLAADTSSYSSPSFLYVKGPEILGKYVGQSEQSVRDLFEKAKKLAPCVLFFDEFESIVPRRGDASSDISDRIVNQFLTELDGVECLSGVIMLVASR